MINRQLSCHCYRVGLIQYLGLILVYPTVVCVSIDVYAAHCVGFWDHKNVFSPAVFTVFSFCFFPYFLSHLLMFSTLISITADLMVLLAFLLELHCILDFSIIHLKDSENQWVWSIKLSLKNGEKMASKNKTQLSKLWPEKWKLSTHLMRGKNLKIESAFWGAILEVNMFLMQLYCHWGLWFLFLGIDFFQKATLCVACHCPDSAAQLFSLESWQQNPKKCPVIFWKPP